MGGSYPAACGGPVPGDGAAAPREGQPRRTLPARHAHRRRPGPSPIRRGGFNFANPGGLVDWVYFSAVGGIRFRERFQFGKGGVTQRERSGALHGCCFHMIPPYLAQVHLYFYKKHAPFQQIVKWCRQEADLYGGCGQSLAGGGGSSCIGRREGERILDVSPPPPPSFPQPPPPRAVNVEVTNLAARTPLPKQWSGRRVFVGRGSSLCLGCNHRVPCAVGRRPGPVPCAIYATQKVMHRPGPSTGGRGHPFDAMDLRKCRPKERHPASDIRKKNPPNCPSVINNQPPMP